MSIEESWEEEARRTAEIGEMAGFTVDEMDEFEALGHELLPEHVPVKLPGETLPRTSTYSKHGVSHMRVEKDENSDAWIEARDYSAVITEDWR